MSIAREELDPGKGIREALYSYLWARFFVVLAIAVSFIYFVSHHPQWLTKLLALYLIFVLYLLGGLLLMRMEERDRFLLLHFLADTLVISYLYTFYPLTGVPFSIFYLFPLFMGGLVLPFYQVALLDALVVAIFTGISMANKESWLFMVLHLFSFSVVMVASFILRRDVVLAEKEREEARKWRALYRTVADYIPAGLVVIDEAGLIRAVNPRARELMGIEAEEEPALRFFPFLKEIGAEAVERMEGELVREGGHKIPIGYTLVPFAQGSRLMIFTDLTNVKRMEEEQRRSRFLALLGRMSADLAHDLRNPLGAIKGAADILKGVSCKDGDFEELIGIITTETERLDALITDFLIFASPTVGSRRKEVVDLGELLRALVERSGFKGRVELEGTSNSPRVVGHRVHLERVFRNLLENAVEADTRERGIRVYLGEGGEGEVMVSVQDWGEGIPEELLTEVFRPFFSTKPQGVGLGLSICQRIVEEHGGKIFLDSRPGEGTIVTVVLPRGEMRDG